MLVKLYIRLILTLYVILSVNVKITLDPTSQVFGIATLTNAYNTFRIGLTRRIEPVDCLGQRTIVINHRELSLVRPNSFIGPRCSLPIMEYHIDSDAGHRAMHL